MKNKSLVITAMLVTLAVGVYAQEAKPSAKALSPSEAALASWNEIGRKIIAMAEDFPED